MDDPRLTKCLTAKRESKSVEFKEQFSPFDVRQSLEVLKDMVAIANSGGGALVIGITNSGQPSGCDVGPVLEYDHAKYCDLVRKYTLQHFTEFEVVEAEKDGHVVAVFIISAPDYPLVFDKPGTYPVENNKQQTAFSQGTIYFRHGAKSETGTTEDLRKFMQSRVREMQDQLVKGLRRVSEAPRGSQLEVVPAASADQTHTTAVAFRLTDDPKAAGAVAIARDKICPYRQKEVIAKLKERLKNEPIPNSHDLGVINKVYDIGSNEKFSWKPEFSSRQYSDTFVDWLVESLEGNDDFLGDARRRLYEMKNPSALQFG
jgi:hypothetical protein